ncbi:MAG: ABC transporter ATP-binding protein [Dethiobacteria bacterium]
MSRPLVVKNFSFAYKEEGRKIIDKISFSLDEGEVLGIIGLSGCGKSTLCFALCGIIPHFIDGYMEGEVLLFGKNTTELTLPGIATRVGIVFQDPETQLFLPVVKNEIAFGPENICLLREEIARRITEVAHLTKIMHLLERNPNTLSGGEQQLVALSAVLALDPQLLILDEVSSQLDAEHCEMIFDIVSALKEKGRTIVMVDHNYERLAPADKLLALDEPSAWLADKGKLLSHSS